MPRSVRHRAARRWWAPQVRYSVPVVSPYTDRLRQAVIDGYACRRITVTIGERTMTEPEPEQPNEAQAFLDDQQQRNADAEAGYEAYGDHAGWRNFTGGRMPAWEDLPTNTQQHWVAAAAAVRARAVADATLVE